MIDLENLFVFLPFPYNFRNHSGLFQNFLLLSTMKGMAPLRLEGLSALRDSLAVITKTPLELLGSFCTA